MSKETGGHAFPSKKRGHVAGYPTDSFEPVDGMSLRDYFAAKAMQGICSHQDTVVLNDDGIASYAYEMADAMIKARDA